MTYFTVQNMIKLSGRKSPILLENFYFSTYKQLKSLQIYQEDQHKKWNFNINTALIKTTQRLHK
ncbi:hypothetical protein HCH_06385 [Hahella chejuensis KCTC 2396]|uniref:Uncharacterized protein n=1 Tax=Hahella chejuensis (strain KCTC 2396) TaxID=349521 RepID=Q2S8J5_HAHCH|nr:hypothetical protein HCH_06385 [Hahella chejuensis KCTC 2396]